MPSTRPEEFDYTGVHEPLLGDDRSVDVQTGSDEALKNDISPESVIPKVVAVMICFVSVGIFTGSVGALIPSLETYYNIQDAKVTLILIMSVAGYLIGAANLDSIHLLTGRRGVALIAASLHVLGIAILATKPTYAIALLAYFCCGMGTGCVDAGFCAWAANVHHANAVQGSIHGAFSVGCVVGPIIVAALEKAGLEWNVFYMVMLGTFSIELCALPLAFRRDNGPTYRASRLDETRAKVTLADGKRPIIYCALFYLCYVGIETSLSTWLVTLMSRSRESSTYVAALTSSMFWGGMAIGRFTLGPLARAANLRLIVIVYILLSLPVQLFFRFSLNGGLSLALAGGIGFSFGPMFPAGVLMLSSQLPKSLQVRGCSVAASVGQIGGAGAPFLLGLVAQSLGIERLLDLVLVMTILLLVIWLRFSRRDE
ncbi:major facilitator superfamily domain-containing protein [Talaromyces proteolyticus]|uniref:Major facilitator superfamily domain-containing protein n=1 Tax=Talaromyces proteolyticus TaxID=1131652 RepID=A0AAD4L4G6_9EURO|nr:major facilitator superfamily domain-containing protein [Talaromyces proteolyticus]KAH8705728.1 major facilitator superfamily domain-containing protein [Talaromyces proteolyticus]